MKRIYVVILIIIICLAAAATYLVIRNQSSADKQPPFDWQYEECSKRYRSFTGAGYTYTLPQGVNCDPYRDRLLKEYGPQS